MVRSITEVEAKRIMNALQPSEFIVACPGCDGLLLVDWNGAPDALAWIEPCPAKGCRAILMLRMERYGGMVTTSATVIDNRDLVI